MTNILVGLDHFRELKMLSMIGNIDGCGDLDCDERNYEKWVPIINIKYNNIYHKFWIHK